MGDFDYCDICWRETQQYTGSSANTWSVLGIRLFFPHSDIENRNITSALMNNVSYQIMTTISSQMREGDKKPRVVEELRNP